MKAIKNISLLFLIATVLVFPSCGGGDDDPSVSLDEKLNGTWSLSSVTRDAADVTSEFSGFSITLSSHGPNSGSGSYSANNGGNLITNGEYYVDATSVYVLNESNGSNNYSLTTSSLSNEDKTLTIGFYNPTSTFGGGRTEGAEGDYVFVLTK